jgi:tetratricopeptide (TPR) repeat protein
MTRTRIYIVLLLAVCCNLNSFSLPGLADSAAVYYEKNEFRKAADYYEKILAEGKESWMLHYNLGNAYFKSDQVGKAIFHYEVAKKMNPTSEDLLNNLRIAETKVIDKIEHREVFLENEIRDFFIYRLSTSGWAWLGIGMLVLCLFLFFLYYISQSPGSKRFFFWSALVLSIVFILSFIFGFMALNEKNAKVNGVITSSQVTIYNSPRSEESNRKNYTLNEGTKVRILDTDDEWANIQLANGNEGWIKATQVGIY